MLWKNCSFPISPNTENVIFKIGEMVRVIIIFGGMIVVLVLLENSTMLVVFSEFIILLAALLKNDYTCEL